MAKRGFDGIVMRAYGARDHDVTVTGTEQITPTFLRVRMHSDTLLREISIAPTAYVRFWMPDPDDPQIEQQRGYTLNDADPDTGDFAIDFVLHEPAGPASAWARGARPGDTIRATPLGSTRFDVPEEPPAGYLLVGDAASIPAINGILGALPADLPVEVYLEQHDEDDRLIPLTPHPLARVHRVPRRGATSLAAAIEARDWSDWSVWAAAESGSLKHLRARLRDEFGFPRSEVHATAYWFSGRAFGTKRAKTVPEEIPDDPAETPIASAPAAPVAPEAGEHPAAEPARGSWRSQAAGRLIAPLRPALVAAGLAQAIVTLLQLAPFVLLTEFARLLVTEAGADRLWALGGWAAALLIAGAALESALLAWLHRVDASFERDLRGRLLAKLARVPLGWFDARDSGRVAQLVQNDTLSLHYLVTHAVPDAVAAVVAPVAVLAYLFAVDWRVALVLLLPVLAYLVAMAIMLVQSGARTAEAATRAERMNGHSSAFLDAQPVTRVFPGAADLSFRARLGEYIRFLGDWQRPMNGQKAFIDLATRPATFLLLICTAGTALIATGAMAPVSILPFLLLGTTFGARLMGVGYGLAGLRTGLIAARRIQVALDEPELETRAPDGAAADGTVPDEATADGDAPAGLVEFDRVSFSYRPGVPVLGDVSLTLEPGTVTAVVGPSGSGKSTLAALLARFHDVDGGAVRVGGRDVRELTPDELYARVGFVFQQTQLIRATVRENIALSAPDAPPERVVAAARAAQIHERILRLPRGYDTMLDADAALSGGERQRLTIARAMLADTPVLVLDEATAFADPESEYHVQRALDRLTAGRTVLVIAHRLHTVTAADRIVVLDHGRVSEQGTHDELLARDGRYRALWEAGAAPARERSGR